MTTDFDLDERLEQDTLPLASWPLCELRMMNDSRYPWLLLIPRTPGATELYQLTPDQRKQLDSESVLLGESLMRIFDGDKLNVAALGNMVSQLHVHHIVRQTDDEAWPAPVWGKGDMVALTEAQYAERIVKLAPLIHHIWT